jgi:tetratricopeptide (TPR) repeat protein
MAYGPPKVFISYSHDSSQHRERVRALADRLRTDGIESWIDQYAQDPNEGWIRWMRQQVKQADKVLLIFTETYQRRFEGDEEKGKGLGATFEGVIVTQTLYESGGRNAKFRPVVFREEDEQFLPLELQGFNRYRVDTPEHYQILLRWLYEAPSIVAPTIGQKPDLPPEPAPELFSSKTGESRVFSVGRSPDRAFGAASPKSPLSNLPDRNPFFTDREQPLAQIEQALAERGRVALSGLGGVGKTQTALEYAHRHLDEYTYTFWATAHSRAALLLSYRKIARLLELPESAAEEQPTTHSPKALLSSYVKVAGILELPESTAKEQATAHSGEALLSRNVPVAGLLNRPESVAKEQSLAVDALKRWLNSNGGWLLILDNADDLTMANQFIPPGKNGHVLLTTQGRAVGRMARLVEIQEMGAEDGALFVLRRASLIKEDSAVDAASEADQASAKEIATQLDGLPLALDQAAAYIEETECGLVDYLNRYQHHPLELLRHRGWEAPDQSDSVATDHPASVALTFALSFENVEKANPTAAELLRFCAFVDRDGIPVEVFSKGAPELGSVLETLGSDDLALDSAMSKILKYSLLKRDRRDPKAKIRSHRLVRDVLKQGMDQSTQRLWAERTVRAVGRAFPRVEFSTWPDCERLLPQAQVCAELVTQWGFAFPESARLLNDAGVYLSARGRYTEAKPLYEQALAIRKMALGPEHPDVATSASNLAVLYVNQDQYAPAEPLYQLALAVQEKALGPEHPDVARSLNNLAELYRAQGQYAQAEFLCCRALAIREKALGPEHPDVAESLNNLAALYFDQGQYAKAEPLCRRALAIREKALGPQHPDVAESVNNLAVFYAAQSQYAEAESLYQRALAIWEKVLGPEHPNVAYSLNGLATFYAAQGQYPKAKPLYERALAIREKALGPEHPDVATSLDYLAVLYADQGQYARAKPHYERSLAIREKALGPEHPDVAESLDYLAVLYADQGQYAQAESFYKRALTIREKALGPEHPNVARSLNNLAALNADQGQYAQAEPLCRRSLAIREKALGPEHPDVARSLNNLAELYRAQGQYPKAEPLCWRALAIYEKALGPEHPGVARSLNNLAVFYADQGQYAQAEPLYERSLAIREKALGPEHLDVATSLENYAYLLRNVRRPEEASRLESRARGIRAAHV